MKQVIAFLSVLCAVLVLCAWLMAADSMRMSSLLQSSTRQIRQLQLRIEKDEQALEESKKQSLEDAEKLKKLTEERDEIQAALTAENKLQLAELSALTADYQSLAIACMELETKLAHSEDDSALAAASFDQQRAEDARRIAELETALTEALHVPQPTPFIPPRYLLPLN